MANVYSSLTQSLQSRAVFVLVIRYPIRPADTVERGFVVLQVNRLDHRQSRDLAL